jgi:hypothetical protein
VGPLLGRFKGEDGERFHLLLMSEVTASGFEPRRWLDLLVRRREEQGFLRGPAFVDSGGVLVSSGIYETLILATLTDHQAWEAVHVREGFRLFDRVKIDETYGIFRSFKRGAITRAQEAKVPQAEVEFMGQWRSVEQAAGRKPSRSIREHYTELSQLLVTRLSFSKAL